MAHVPPGDTLFDHAACALVVTGTDGLIAKVNATACAWLGYAEEELVGQRRMRDLLPVGARLFYHTHCQPILEAQGSVAEIQVALVNRRKERLPVLINIARRSDGDGVFDHWALFKVADRHAYERELLAARKAAEAALEARREAEARLQAANEQLSAADRRKDEFLATLSHELRNPLAPMRSALDVLKFKLGADADPRLLGAFDRQLRHLTRLVDDLMEVSRITQGRMQLSRAPVELAALVRGAAQDLVPLMTAARHTLQVFAAEPPVLVNGDATRLAQVVINLLTNAAKYTPDGGAIELHLACLPGIAEIRVRDNGIGIPAAALPTVFDMFSQLEPALERSKGGLGIGLALVRGIVALHGGTVDAASAGASQGSEFTVRLPLAAGAACPAAEPATRQARSAATDAVRVLIVDDNRDAAETLAMALQVSGYETRTVHTAGAALEIAAAFRPEAALLDIGLPDMNGYELARLLRQLPGGTAMKLVATTGWGQQKDRERALEAGFDHHMTKPVELAILRDILPGTAADR
ncbi:hybrid sensor histidine kinase/response regulator [Pseudoduganella lutea]|uniref:histidine kinase n=1 Tax=Pseudoduganella lutea TaxID=321985 RepID=A0A4P6KZR3_9BURK|nr:ATP-binding protein [Pseudoduganella lutea]QBE63818.1 response regulator [Pseudoduganella lutea]